MKPTTAPKVAFALPGVRVKSGLNMMCNTLDKLQLTLIELEYAVAEVLHQIDTISLSRSDGLDMLRQHARILGITTNNIVTFAYLSLKNEINENTEQN